MNKSCRLLEESDSLTLLGKMELKIDEQIARIISEIDGQIVDCWGIKKEDVLKAIENTQVLNNLEEWLKKEMKRLGNNNILNHDEAEKTLKIVLEKLQKLKRSVEK